MRKPFLPFVIIGLIATIGVFFALTYKFPEVEAFQFYQQIDQEIVTCEKKSPDTLETTLNALQSHVREIILVGQTYDGSQDVTELFTSFNAEYEVLKEKSNLSLVNILLHTGRHHQIRVQFASRNHPLYGDQRYGETSKKQLALFAYYLSFNHPVTKEKLEFIKYPDKVGIWKEFIC